MARTFKTQAEKDAFAAQGRAMAAAKRRGYMLPCEDSLLDVLDRAGLTDESWRMWRIIWKVVEGQPLTPAELEAYRFHTGRQAAPEGPVREV